MRPRSTTTIRFATARASAKSCVTITTVIPVSRAKCFRCRSTRRRFVTSKALVGSSAKRIWGFKSLTWAWSTRWSIPPESSVG